jgi:prefoldin subunit 5
MTQDQFSALQNALKGLQATDVDIKKDLKEILDSNAKITGKVMKLDSTLREHGLRIERLESRKRGDQEALQPIDIGGEKFDPELTPGRGIRVDATLWSAIERLQKDHDRVEAEKRGAVTALAEERVSAAEIRHKLAWLGGLIAALVGGLTYAFTHFARL